MPAPNDVPRNAEALKNNIEHVFYFLSELLGRPVLNAAGTRLGKLTDLKIKMDVPYPPVTHLVFKKRFARKGLALAWDAVDRLSSDRITLKSGSEQGARPLEVAQDEFLIRDELLDKQVVDTFDAKIERVNDVHLLMVNRDLRVVHVEYGLRGLFRRLGCVRFVDAFTRFFLDRKIEDKMISWKYVQPLLSDPAKKNLKLNVTVRKLQELHPSELADIIEDLDKVSQSTIFQSLDLQTAAQTLEELADPRLQASLIESASVELASDILEEMAPDEATDLLADLPEERKTRIIQKMEKSSRAAVEELLKFEEGTAGSLMTKDYFSVGQNATIGQAIEDFRKTTYPLDSVAYIYVTDAGGRLVGVSTLRQLLVCDKDALLKSLMNTHLVQIESQDSVKTVIDLFRKYKFMSLPVVDADGILRGIITLKDVMASALEG